MAAEFIKNAEAYDIGDGGRAVLRHNNKVVFVKGLVPGDIADIEIIKTTKNYAEGKVITIIQLSKNRVPQLCSHFGTCGGCSWQNLNYATQLALKQKQVTESFKRIAGVEVETTLPIIGAEKTYYYRNKLEFTFSSKRWLTHAEMQDRSNFGQPGLGFHVQGLFDKVIDLKECYLQPQPSDAIRMFVHNLAIKEQIPFFDLRTQEGFLRNMMIRTTNTGEVMVMLSFFKEDKPMRERLLRHILTEFPQITTLVYAINPKKNDNMADLAIETFSGKGYITEQIKRKDGSKLNFRISPQSFFQTNTVQANRLYDIITEFAEFNGHENVFDLYTGCGTIASFIAPKVKTVKGIEYVKQAVIDARINTEVNCIKNAEFFDGDMQYMLNEDFCNHNGKPDVIISDPPRNGMHPDTINDIARILPAKIIYVSCNPATQARDVAMLTDKYRVQKIQPVDMFPHTTHVENVALLVKK